MSTRVEHSHRTWLLQLLLAASVGLVVATMPVTAGNGLEALRSAAVAPTATIGLTLVFAKLAATSAAIGSGAPGGVVSPSLAIAAGAALTTFAALDAIGIDLAARRWDGVVIAMAVGLAVSVQAPLMALTLVAEMTGDLRVLPLTAVAVAVAVGMDRALDRRSEMGSTRAPSVHDEDG